ncbi:malto-oligosyltrehalose synthase [Pedobacter faecalis]|uniref:malto-oligosyltrehalose synthase n=1 Tax=Pedobacter faecalis TaxID=3041495 RepID=UPI00254ABB73|nr:malto-oligosyltrehalose synthase [Pedobacter sp. ELA7]
MALRQHWNKLRMLLRSTSNHNLLSLILPSMYNPVSTYRIQFNQEFSLSHFEEIIPYLDRLGVKTIYASPIFKAVPGSMHGYDGINPEEINPEIGTLEELVRISGKLKAREMGWIQDIVPNHMGFHQDNTWLMDVLRNGESSTYRHYFDIISGDLSKEPLMVPFLGGTLEEVIERNELSVEERGDEWFFKYFDSYWPLRPDTDTSAPLEDIAAEQHYRLCSYKESNEQMNYRRFFTVNSLICLNIQREEVFEAYHRFTKELVDQGIFQGVRIDHVDGLYDPEQYLLRLRALLGPDTYIVVEKILEPGELLPVSWPIQGTTGYDYLGTLNQLFTNRKAEKKFNRFYRGLERHDSSIQSQIHTKKREFLQAYMQGELNNLTRLVSAHLEQGEQDPALPAYREILSEILVRCPVYRYYSNQYPLTEEETEVFGDLFKELDHGDNHEQIKTLKEILFRKDIALYQRLMQFTGPLMAKGVEDTLMYTYNRFIGNNEVGDSPEQFGITTEEFHDTIAQRYSDWPLAMNATATHDTKRGEDARARLNVLTDLGSEWLDEVRNWRELNAELKQNGAPDANDEYFIYQTLVATCPVSGPEAEDYQRRLLEYIEKALRESKRNSEWDEPDRVYEEGTRDFILALLDTKGVFWPVFAAFLHKVAEFGQADSLAALIIKMCSPGIPDTYQGTEFWDLSMVDPDNRRAVDYTLRSAYLQEFETGDVALTSLWSEAHTGKVKLLLLHKLLQLRLKYPALFSEGDYLPVEVKGKYASSVVSFARRYDQEWVICIVPVSLVSITATGAVELFEVDWADTRLVLPKAFPGEYQQLLQSAKGKASRELPLSEIFADMPFSLIYAKTPPSERGAGILMHISSLPSAFGIGDFGPAAADFLQFLARAGQKYWQVLPMNPLTEDQAYSPYSATSVMAGNTLLISPELLHQEGLLDDEDIRKNWSRAKKKISYQPVEQLKKKLLAKAYRKYKEKLDGAEDQAFEEFCQQESPWLSDYALYEGIKSAHQGRAWFDWPAPLRNRDEKALAAFEGEHQDMLREIRWQQYVFFKQWHELRQTARVLGIQLIGDLPFYTAYDSADVWANRAYFSVSPQGKLKGVAGVPPDYFNADGQLWGMPVYNWKAMAKDKYRWWVDRIAKNLELYDIIRLDHFRAFAAYWEVPAQASTAKEGSWVQGPGQALFDAFVKRFGQLPFIAEDLGEITEDVYQLRDQYALPGMKVLQFGFGEDMPESIHTPHNYPDSNCIVYTGTHDNNTMQGWYEQEADGATGKRLEQYAGHKVTGYNVVETMMRLAYASVAKIAIVPVQDVLAKRAKARMNTPATIKGNWAWRLKHKELDAKLENRLFRLARLYRR